MVDPCDADPIDYFPTAFNSSSLRTVWSALMRRTVPELPRITSESVETPWPV